MKKAVAEVDWRTQAEDKPASGSKPAGLTEFTPRAILCRLVVALGMGASYPYIVLKLGFGPNASVVSAFLGYLLLGIAFKDYNRWENNIVQTAGTAAAQTAFMCVLLAAFDMLGASRTVSFTLTLTPLQSFTWLTTAGLLGVLLAVPMRQHFVVDEKLTYADGMAAGETLIVLDGRGTESRRAASALAIGCLASAALMLMTEDARVVNWFPSVMVVGTAVTRTTGVGVNWSLLALGSGMLVGMRINASMLLGMILAWIVAPYALLQYQVLGGRIHQKRRAVLGDVAGDQGDGLCWAGRAGAPLEDSCQNLRPTVDGQRQLGQLSAHLGGSGRSGDGRGAGHRAV